MLQLGESWMRPHQVLPMRTHPHMTCSGTGGFVLTGIAVAPEGTRAAAAAASVRPSLSEQAVPKKAELSPPVGPATTGAGPAAPAAQEKAGDGKGTKRDREDDAGVSDV